jgi:hypothetical protein
MVAFVAARPQVWQIIRSTIRTRYFVFHLKPNMRAITGCFAAHLAAVPITAEDCKAQR